MAFPMIARMTATIASRIVMWSSAMTDGAKRGFAPLPNVTSSEARVFRIDA